MQKIIAITGVSLFIIKLVAWYLTDSVAILTDTLESTINVISGFIGLYSLHLSALPKDANHPYGHGKVEFITAAIEGTLICTTGIYIIYEATVKLYYPHNIGRLDTGILLVALTAAINWLVGHYAILKGEKNNSLVLIASGKHLQADTYTTAGIIVGLILLYFTKIPWLDSVVAMLFSLLIIITGYKILRTSVAGMMDEADDNLLAQVVEKLNSERRENWIDLHNLRIIKYGGVLHLDCHLTVPWYLNVNQAHKEVESLEKLVKTHFGESVELFVHTDGCLDFSCKICTKTDCEMRKHPFLNKIEWTVANISANQKHRII